MDKKELKRLLKKTWHFIWEEDSLASWIVNIILAFVLIKFIVYPGLGLILSTSHPIVAVVSSSMEHNNDNLDMWWDKNKDFYSDYGITKQDFLNYRLRNGFNKGDIMVLKGVKPQNIKIGDVIVFRGGSLDPIIHRVINNRQQDNTHYFQTKGDNNKKSIEGLENNINEEAIIGKAVFRIPLLGYIKIWFVDLLRFFSILS